MQIGSIGFPEDQRVKLEKIFRLSKQTRYELVDIDFDQLPDLLLVFGFDLSAHSALQNLPQQYHSRIILVGRGKPDDKSYAHLGYPLVSSRVLRALDKMTNENEEMSCDPAVTEEQENRFSKYEQQAIEAPVTSSDRKAFQVLVVDDNEVMQQALNAELQQLPLPVNVRFAGSGEEAMEQVAEHQFDFIFLDVVMPGMDGFETCTEMRKRPDLKKIPIIMLTSKTSPMDEVKGIMSGCSTYLTKPIVHEEFQKVINRVSNWVEEFQKA
ncbi:response regulator [Neptuniibacter caesariensis]|uniref:CheY subfamily protein n=1 Tax=Neptuniibacter caesariensis TaxID=207954 RepID=A0A7U8GTW0_NEPCE|nr:response regulator [Neptuniibacter caesariensis]EAR62530.1 CheY subfamily protein [Oceanospirillum sp. MED92] [Neptuniibacter caesariensis]